jgi:hypothetical protein
LKKILKGIIEDNAIRIEKEIGLPVGTQTLVILKTLHKEKQDEIINRQIKILNKGFNLGKKFFSTRDDFYNR